MKLNPYIAVHDAAAAIDFYKRAFGATECGVRFTEPNGRIGHAELTIGESLLMLSDEYPEVGAVAPATLGGCPVLFRIVVSDADAVVEQALAAGATLLRAIADEAHGERSATVLDPFGYRWMISTLLDPVDVATLQERVGEAFDVKAP